MHQNKPIRIYVADIPRLNPNVNMTRSTELTGYFQRKLMPAMGNNEATHPVGTLLEYYDVGTGLYRETSYDRVIGGFNGFGQEVEIDERLESRIRLAEKLRRLQAIERHWAPIINNHNPRVVVQGTERDMKLVDTIVQTLEHARIPYAPGDAHAQRMIEAALGVGVR